MPPDATPSPDPAQEARVTRFTLGILIWFVSLTCFVWETTVVKGQLFFDNVVLPILGELTGVEAIVLTLTFFTFAMAALHGLMHLYHRYSQDATTFWELLPAWIGPDILLPKPLRWIKLIILIGLFIWPTVCHCFLTGRLWDHYRIVPNKADPATLYQQGRYLARNDLFLFPLQLPAGSQAGDAFWWVGTRKEVRNNERKWVTAVPWQPAFILISSVGLGLSMFIFLGNAVLIPLRNRQRR